jgi:hypothetical protein
MAADDSRSSAADNHEIMLRAGFIFHFPCLAVATLTDDARAAGAVQNRYSCFQPASGWMNILRTCRPMSATSGDRSMPETGGMMR